MRHVTGPPPAQTIVIGMLFLLLLGGLSFFDLPQNKSMDLATPPGGSSSSVWWVGAESSDSSALPNTGVSANVQALTVSVPGCLAYWVADGFSNGLWGQVGYNICNSSGLSAFYQVWNLNSNTVVATGGAPIAAGTHSFSMYATSGTNWGYFLDGSLLGSYNMGESVSSSTYPVEAMSEEQGSAVFTISSVEMSPALKVQKAETWWNVAEAVSYGNSWGVEGSAQLGTLGSDAFLIGSSIPALPPGTVLWGTALGTSSSASSTTRTSSTSITTSLSSSTASSSSSTTSTFISSASSISVSSTLSTSLGRTTSSAVSATTTRSTAQTSTETSTSAETSAHSSSSSSSTTTHSYVSVVSGRTQSSSNSTTSTSLAGSGETSTSTGTTVPRPIGSTVEVQTQGSVSETSAEQPQKESLPSGSSAMVILALGVLLVGAAIVLGGPRRGKKGLEML